MEEQHPPPEAGHPCEPLPQTERIEPPEPGEVPSQEPPLPLDQRLLRELAGLLADIATLDNQEMALKVQLEDVQRTKHRLHGAVLTLQKLEERTAPPGRR